MSSRDERADLLDVRDALTLHDRLLALNGGASGLRDEGLLKSALARPQQHFAYARAAGVIQLAAFYTAGIVRNHPFVDGNKRTGFVAGILFLELNGYSFTASEEDAANAVLALADGGIDESVYAKFLEVHIKACGAGNWSGRRAARQKAELTALPAARWPAPGANLAIS